MSRVELDVDAIAHGGDGIGRREGKVVFIPDAVPGDRAVVEITEDRGRFERGRLIELVRPAPERIEPRCPHFERCGGCRWQMVDRSTQIGWRTTIVESQLAHLGGLFPPVRSTLVPGPGYGYRNRMDFVTAAGRPALREERSHRTVPLEVCLLLTPPLAEAFDRIGRLERVDRLTLRAGVRTGDAVALVEGEIPDWAQEWGIDVTADPHHVIFEEVAGRRFQITGRAFFQVNTEGAETLVGLVREAIGPGPDVTVLDAYAGGGLFSATVGSEEGRMIAVESDPVAVDDLLANTADEVEVIESRVETALSRIGEPVDVVIVDPPRSGLGRQVVDLIVGLGPEVIVSVSCDVASFARDARWLVEAGYRLEWVQPVDMFPQTPHIETVARLTRR